ncbi:MAG: bifunctional O-acetylhomoserine aminocarboxypropyltransferase/cysteine synthase [Gammaproteobacteria bacterium]|nr:bifunctional O-acetylhomoserine aminocarboxypropyltransferase/cysteine synthase [Gammaproteobacteria bacterium]
MRDETLAIHAGYQTDPTTKAVVPPICQNVAFEFDDAAHGAALFNLEVPGNIYTRIMNPTCDVLEQRVAALEGGIAALAVSSGMAAITYALQTLASQGHNIVTTPQLYGGTYTLFAHMLPSQGVEVRFAETDRAEDLEKLVDDNTRAIYCETIGNPAGNIVDIKPIELGANIVVHALTKFMGGHGNSLGGIIVDGGNFDWTAQGDKFPGMTAPEPAYHDVVYSDAFGPAAFIARARTVPLRNTGAALAPMNAFLLLQGIETLNLRMERHCENAQKAAEFLQSHAKVEWVSYAGLPEHPHYELAKTQLGGTPSALLTFGIKGGFEAGVKFYDALGLFKRLVNIGDARSLACHPASTTHRQLSETEQLAVGVKPEMIRLCVGIEHIDDILADLEQALAAV